MITSNPTNTSTVSNGCRPCCLAAACDLPQTSGSLGLRPLTALRAIRSPLTRSAAIPRIWRTNVLFRLLLPYNPSRERIWPACSTSVLFAAATSAGEAPSIKGIVLLQLRDMAVNRRRPERPRRAACALPRIRRGPRPRGCRSARVRRRGRVVSRTVSQMAARRAVLVAPYKAPPRESWGKLERRSTKTRRCTASIFQIRSRAAFNQTVPIIPTARGVPAALRRRNARSIIPPDDRDRRRRME